MAFVAPLMLAAFAALAIPVAIHLIQRERKRVVEFPSLMFLRRIPYQSVRRRRIRDWALLAMRLAALALIVLAFARPFLRRPVLAAANTSGAREAVILVDTSYSMDYADRWTRARGAARDAINRLGPGDHASLVFFSTGADVAVRSSSDRGRLQAALASATTGPGATRYAPALKLAGSLLAESPLPRREVILITDFQRRGWEQTAGKDDVRMPARTVLTPVDVASGESANLAVTPVSLQWSRYENHDRVAVTGGVVNHSGAPVRSVNVALEIDGQVIQTIATAVAAHGSASVAFSPVTIVARNTRAAVRLPKDGLERDNVFDFVVSPSEPVHTVLIDRPGSSQASMYLTRALSIGDAPRVDLIERSPEQFSDADARLASVVMLNDVQTSDNLADKLTQFVTAGGGLFIIAGPHATWPAHAAALVPGLPGDIVDRTTAPARLGALEYSHPVFELFRAPRSGDFSAARFYSYRAVTQPAGQVLARFDDGTPALLERRTGAGRVLMWTSTFDLDWNDMAVKAVFLPFAHTVTRYLADYVESPPSFTVGQVVPAPRKTGLKSTVGGRGGVTAIAPSGARVNVETGDGALALAEQGFYDIRTQGAAGDSAVTIACNVDLGESDLAPMDPRDLAAALAGHTGSDGGQSDAHPTNDAQAQAQRLWWYLLVAGGLLLAGESLLSNRLSQDRTRLS